MNRFIRDESGATAIEYGLIAALIFLAIVGGMTTFGNKTNQTYQVITDAVNKVL